MTSRPHHSSTRIPADTTETGAADRAEMREIGIWVVAYCCVVLLINVVHGTVGIPRNDDWSFYSISMRFATEGHFVLNGWPQMFLLGQAILAWPIVQIFGNQIAPLQLLVLALSGAGLWLCHHLVRTFLPRALAAHAVACLALGPIFATVGFSFMTDVPSMTMQIASLVIGGIALRSVPTRMGVLALSLAVATWGFTIREYSVLAGVVVLLVAAVREWGARSTAASRMRHLAAIAVVWVAVLAGMFRWRTGLPMVVDTRLVTDFDTIRRAFPMAWTALLTLTAMLAPATLMVSPFRATRAALGRRPVLTVVLLAAIAFAYVNRPRFLGNHFTLTGTYRDVVAGPPGDLLPRWLWDALHLLGAYSLAIIVLVLIHCVSLPRRRDVTDAAAVRAWCEPAGLRLVQVFVGLFIVMNLVVILLTDAPFFDRYLIIVIPLASALILRSASRENLMVASPRSFGAAVLVVTALVGAVFVESSSAFDGARWKLAQRVESLGYDAATIDGGFEWFSYHQPDPVTITPAPFDPTPMQGGFWRWIFTPRPVCVTIAKGDSSQEASGNENPPVVASLRVKPLLSKPIQLYAFAGPAACSPWPAAPPG